ncbi:MAG: dephospho-CoA kinase [Hominenteromicrobium sp.]|uniref:dephospho-CoA kinase n=1 Tax=Hominenteromicrobium sp. TaxID=3073581 RepID=UPI0039A352C5
MLDAPTLFEAGADRLCRRMVSVLADETVRLGRICRRDGLTEQEALTRMHAQQSDDFYIDRSDYTLDNTVAVSADNMDNMLAVLGCAHPGESD